MIGGPEIDGPDREPPPRASAPRRLLALLRPLRLVALERRYGRIRPRAAYTFVNGALSIGLLALVAYLTRSPFIFPSLGPTAYLFFRRPTAAAACPRNTLLGHLIGATVGWCCLVAFGLLDAPPALVGGLTWPHVGATALSLGGTSALMVLLHADHPPAGATTLIVSLGLMPHLWQLGVLMAAVLLLTGQAFVINRLAGIAYPAWCARTDG